MSYTNNALCLSGGGIKGLLLVGSLYQLELSFGPLGNIFDEFSGSSVGAIIAMFLAIGYSAREIWNLSLFLENSDVSDINISGFLENKSLNKGDKLKKFLIKKLESKGYNQYTTFKELPKNLSICAVSLNTRRPEYFNKRRTPNIILHVILLYYISSLVVILYQNIYHSCRNCLR